MATLISTQKSTFRKTTTQMAVVVEENGERTHEFIMARTALLPINTRWMKVKSRTKLVHLT